MLTPTADALKKYIKENKRHAKFVEANKLYDEIRMHADGEKPGNLIEARRPGESEYILNYRKAIYQPKTKTQIGKVFNTFGQIRRSTDWSIKYDEKAIPKFIPEAETLSEYCEKKFPRYASLTKWYFDVTLKQQGIDANAVALVHQTKDEALIQNKYPTPVITIFNSNRVLDFVEDEFAFLLSEEKSKYKSADGKTEYDNGDVYYWVTPGITYKLSQSAEDKSSFNILQFNHPHNIFPAFILGGIEKCKGLYESRINGMIPSLNVAVTLYSDKQAEIVQHVHSEKWVYQTQQCKECSGTGRISANKSAPVECSKCKGIGVVNTSPYSNMIINPNSMPLGEKSMPIPPAGFIQKTDVALMVKAMSEEIKQEIWDALSAVNMEFLMDVPLAESGKSKEVDRDALNTFVYGVAEDAVGVLDKCYFLIAVMRYGYQIKDIEAIKAMCPDIPVPEKYDLLSSNYYMEKIKVAKESKLSPFILSKMEIEFSSKEFYNNPEYTDFMQLVDSLNPLPGVSQEDKMVMLSNKGITEKAYVISSNIDNFVKRAMRENADFSKKDQKAQQTIISKYADEVMQETSLKEEVLENSESGSGSGN